MRIPHHDRKFFKRTISGYSKDKIIKYMKDSIFENHKKLALYCGIEIFCSGFFDELFYELFIIMVKYCHTNTPILPKYFLCAYEYYLSAKKVLDKDIIELRNDDKFRHYIEVLIILLCKSNKIFILPKQFQKYFLPMDVFEEEVDDNLKKLKKNIWKLTKLESFNKTKQIEEKTMTYLGFVLNHNSHEHLWNIILEFAKYIPHKHILEQTGYLYQLYSIIEFPEKTFLPLYAILYFFRGTFIKIKQFQEPSLIPHKYYENIRNSLLSNSKRNDFLNFQKPIKPQLYKLNIQPNIKIPIYQEEIEHQTESPPIYQPFYDENSTEQPLHDENELEELPNNLEHEFKSKINFNENEKLNDDNEIIIRIKEKESKQKENVKVFCINTEKDETSFW